MYVDNAATTYVRPEVKEEIFETMERYWGNPSSMHEMGYQAKEKMEKCRKNIAERFNCYPDEIIFTSGACESNSLALNQKGYTTTPIEHKSILGANRVLVDSFGFAQIPNHIETECLSIQAANSEIGTIQDIESWSKAFKDKIFHTDATQYLPYFPIDLQKEWKYVDMFSMSGQKIHAPKGIGFLYCKRGTPIVPLIHGAQENGMRGGTENLPYIAGLAKAIELLDYDNSKLNEKRCTLIKELLKTEKEVKINGSMEHRLPNNISVSFKGYDSKQMLAILNELGVYASAGSACNAGNTEVSPVLKAIGLEDAYSRGTIRLTISNDTNINELSHFFKLMFTIIKS